MRFTVAGNKISCSRIDHTAGRDGGYRRVVDFDAQLGKVPPHVAARLTQFEVKELESFLADRKRIQTNPAEVNMLEALPELLHEATGILGSVDELNVELHQEIHSSIAQLTKALDRVKPRRQSRLTPILSMRKTEALKEKLETIKQDL